MANEEYIIQILQQLPDGLTRAGFYDRCQPDISAGWSREVDAAWLRYKGQNHAVTRGRK